MSLATLPPELYSSILSHVLSPGLQTATLNLSRAVPLSPVPLQPLFEHITISRHQQASQLYNRLCYHPTANAIKSPVKGALDHAEECAWIKSLVFRTWEVDADIVVNLLALLPGIERLYLLIGTIFAPEHLEEIFRRPALALNLLSLRFRPYVHKATYYQFLKGSYFDGIFDLLSRWPSNDSLSHLSIIQDPLPSPSIGSHNKAFAQPIVFFTLTALGRLGTCPAMQNITHLRLRIPSRQLVRFITTPEGGASNIAFNFPSLIYLDLSTCAMREFSEVEALSIHTGRGRLRHMVLDKTGLCNGNEGEWKALGRSCALSGVTRMREREKALKAWREAEPARGNSNQGFQSPGNPLANAAQERRPRRGRRGLAAATISFRNTDTGLPVVRAGAQSDGTSRTGKIRILPSPPRLLSLSTSLSPPLGHPHPDDMQVHEAKARSDFTEGWWEGLSQLRAIWERLRQSQANGVRVVRFSDNDAGKSGSPAADIGEMLEGLEDMGKPGDDEYWEELRDVGQPILCFRGSRGEEEPGHEVEHEWPGHPEGCGHRVALNVWGDYL